MHEFTDTRLEVLKHQITPEALAERVAEAHRQAELIELILAQQASGSYQTAAIHEICPGEPLGTWQQRIKKFQEGGWEALVNRRFVKPPERLTPAVQGFIRGTLAANPELRSHEIADAVKNTLGGTIHPSTVRHFLQGQGLARPEGRPKRGARAEPLPLAGAELLLGVEAEVGAVADLARSLQEALKTLPEPDGQIRDTSLNRDEQGRFLPAYNEGQAKGESEVAPKFRGVEDTSKERDLRLMRTANTGSLAFYRKALSLTMLPCITDSPKWSSLRHWQGDHLGSLVGCSYQPATLDKFMGELKLAQVGDEALEAVAAFWTPPAMHGPEPLEGTVVLYGDTTIKPVWTHDFARCTKVSKNGRVMPAISTIALHAGCGTPLIYCSYSGQVSLPKEIPGLLRKWEELAGKGTVRRLIVMDREAHAVWLFKELDPDWLYIIPLRQSVTGPKAKFEELGDWVPYQEEGDRVRDGFLWLNDSEKKDEPLRVRVVARERHRTGKVAYYATNTDKESFAAGTVIDLYFHRWPAQEHVFRDGNGRVGLNVHHGFGRRKVQNVAVIDRMEELEGQIRKNHAVMDKISEMERHQDDIDRQRSELMANVEAQMARLQNTLDNALDTRQIKPKRFSEDHFSLDKYHEWFEEMKNEAKDAAVQRDVMKSKRDASAAAIERAKAEIEHRASQTRIFTIDVELDHVMTAFKVTFINLCVYLMTHYLGGKRIEIDTLIRAVLTLPGERVRTTSTETIRIFRQPRDREFMPLVEEACRLLTQKRLKRNRRRLIYEVVDLPNR